MEPPVPADSAEAVPVAEPPDDVATVYCWPLREPQHRDRLSREVHLERGHLRPGSIRDSQRVPRAH